MKLFEIKSLTLACLASMAVAASSCSSQPEKLAFQPSTENLSYQSFTISAAGNEVISGKMGGIFAFPAGAFLDSLGNTVSGDVEIRLKEANTMKEIFQGGLITLTGDKMLASDGMYLVEAYQNGKALRLDPAKGYYAYLPTGSKNKEMGLYEGQFSSSKLDWKLVSSGENGLAFCDKDDASRKKCKKCERLVKMASKIKPKKKLNENDSDYWTDRYYWSNGKLMFFSSGSTKTVLSQAQLDECKDYLAATEAGQNLLAKIEDVKKAQTTQAQDYYSFRMNTLGWHNIDRVVKEELVTFTGKVVDEDGKLVKNAQVHLLSSGDLKIHTMYVSTDGTFQLEYLPGQAFNLYACSGSIAGKKRITLSASSPDAGTITLASLSEKDLDSFAEELM